MAYGVNSNPHQNKHPIAGLSALVDVTAQTATVLDTGVIPMSAGKNFLQEASTLRKAPNPLIIVQKGGPSFQLHGNVVTWQNWRFSISFEPRDGLVFHQISYYDRGRWRSILYRLSLSEIFVPYGDPDPQWSWQQELDTAEDGWAQNATPLTKGLDVPNNALVFDSILPDNYTPPFNVKTQASFIQHQFWVTPYNPLQMNAMGRYPLLNENIEI